MGKLTAEQEAALKELEEIRDAPDEGKSGTSRVVNMHVDLGDEKQVRLAHRLGFLDLGEEGGEGGEGEGEGEGSEGEGEGVDTPKRTGYF